MLLKIWRKMKPLCTVSGNVNWCNHYGNCMKIPQKKKKCKIELPCGPAIALLSTKPKGTKMGSQRGICIPCSLQHYSQQPSYAEGGNRQNRLHLESRTPSGARLWILSYMPGIYGNDIPTGKPGPQKGEPQGSYLDSPLPKRIP